MKNIHWHNKQQGAVSLFIVIFTALLITIITISFMQLMVRDQRQATYSDLSDSAYDSAVAGVEDAKRALLMQQDCIGDSSTTCETIRGAINAHECSTLTTILETDGIVKQQAGDEKLEQGYTCVKITQNTDDYLGSIDADSAAKLIPLQGTGDFNKIVVSWALSKNGGSVTLPDTGIISLPKKGSDWPESRPALLRVQLINGQDSFRLEQLDSSGYSNTLFLYPSKGGIVESGSIDFSLDGRRDAANGEPQPVQCNEDVSSGAYACKVTLTIGRVVQPGSQAFLNLMSLYNATDYRIELINDTTRVPFAGVQPEIDSTGRANDLFRRVVSRVELSNTFTYPVAALEVRNNICKNFSVTTEPNDYKENRALCDPARKD